ncbi:MAG: T9SS type A sorting domain-containing protein [Saprospiraceae bacterium]|nr:T9SS type A sorting domain-containing protein [Saprospiraceae bacterium]
MNIKNIGILLPICALWAHIGFAQTFNKTYFTDADRYTFIWQVDAQHTDQIISNVERECVNNQLCISLTSVDKNGNILSVNERLSSSGFRNRMKVRNDTIFYSGRYFLESDSTTYWIFGMTNLKGEELGEYHFPILHLRDTGIGDFGYQTPVNYGLTLVNNNQVILWGEGLDNRQPNPTKVPFRSVFLRVGINGEHISDPFWFDLNDDVVRRMSDACTDIDGNMVFHYEYRDNSILKLSRSIYKILQDNYIQLVADVPVTDLSASFPKIATDSEGNYFINPIYSEGNAPGYTVSIRHVGFISKINRSGDVLWTSMVPPFDYDWNEPYEASRTNEIHRISITRNGDILCSGRVFVRDSFDVAGQNKKVYATGNGSFIARFDTDGKLLWRHFIIPRKRDGKIRTNSVYDIQEAPDGSIITGGRLERDDDDPGILYDAWLMRLTPQGCLTPDCKHIGKYFDFLPEIVSVSEDIVDTGLKIYPNPGKAQINIHLPSDVSFPVQYQISDVQGRIRESGSQAVRNITMDSGYFTSGLYIITIRDSQGKVSRGKWVKE